MVRLSVLGTATPAAEQLALDQQALARAFGALEAEDALARALSPAPRRAPGASAEVLAALAAARCEALAVGARCESLAAQERPRASLREERAAEWSARAAAAAALPARALQGAQTELAAIEVDLARSRDSVGSREGGDTAGHSGERAPSKASLRERAAALRRRLLEMEVSLQDAED